MPTVRSSTVFWTKTFTLQGSTGDSSDCAWKGEYVYDSASSSVTGSVTVIGQGKIDFYILNEDQWTKWATATGTKSSCAAWRPAAAEVSVVGITHYSVSYVVPDNGNHTFFFFNPYMYDAKVSVTLAWA